MFRTLLVVSFSVLIAFVAESVTVEPETDYPIIHSNSMHSWESVRSECLPPTDKDPVERCSVTKLGEMGSLDGKNFFYALYEWLDKSEVEEYGKSNHSTKYPLTNTAVVLFYSTEDAPNMLRPFYADRTDLNVGWFEEPRFIRSPQGVLLQIPHRSSSTTATADLDNLLIWQGSAWHAVDTQSWMDDLQTRVPEGCSVIRGTLVNFEQMKATNYLWKASDANCCPTCGRFSATLALEEDRLVIKTLKHDLKARLK
jgi:hypothetical protein